jgi:hypothetical protein
MAGGIQKRPIGVGAVHRLRVDGRSGLQRGSGRFRLAPIEVTAHGRLPWRGDRRRAALEPTTRPIGGGIPHFAGSPTCLVRPLTSTLRS